MKVVNTLRCTLGFLATLLLWSCGSNTYVQKDNSVDLSSYKTFYWSETEEEHKQKGHNDIQESNIRSAVNNALAELGWRQDTLNADAILAYDFLVERNTRRNSDPVYTRGYSRLYYNPYTRRTGTIYYPPQFAGYTTSQTQVTEGTLTLSIIDARTDRTIWQGWTTRPINTRLMNDREIQSSVSAILKKISRQ